MFTAMGYGVYFFFAALMMCSIVFVWFFVPETKGVPLENMERVFEIKPTRKAHAVVIRELREQDQVFRRNQSIDGGSETSDNEKDQEKSGRVEQVEVA